MGLKRDRDARAVQSPSMFAFESTLKEFYLVEWAPVSIPTKPGVIRGSHQTTERGYTTKANGERTSYMKHWKNPAASRG